MPGTEASWVKKLNKQEPLKNIYSCGMGSMFVNGLPDRYYEGPFKPLWIEFKHIKKETHRFNALDEITVLQRQWLTRCYRNHNYPLVIVGISLTKGFILDRPADWESVWLPARHKKKHLLILEIADYIANTVNNIRFKDD